MSADCIFCKIIKKEIPANVVYEDNDVLGFVDLYPQAKMHLLFIPKIHTKNINELAITPEALVKVYVAISKYTQQEKMDANGFRVVTNLGADAGQTVFHTHFHVVSGEKLGRFGS